MHSETEFTSRVQLCKQGQGTKRDVFKFWGKNKLSGGKTHPTKRALLRPRSCLIYLFVMRYLAMEKAN